MKRILVKILYLVMGLFGYRGSASLALNAMKQDVLNRNVPIKIKLWAWKRGFSGARVYTYEINESNYRSQIPDFDYYKLHPINGRYSSWIDDKLTMKYILSPFNEYLPKYYFQIEDGEILKLMDCPEEINPDIDGIITILKKEGNLALKLLASSLGVGFYRLTYENEKFYINTKETSLKELKDLIKKLEGYLVTEYIISHQKIREIYDVTPNTLRVQLTRDKNKTPKVTGSFIRFGSSESGVLESPTAGGIIAKVELIDGKVNEVYTIEENRLNKIDNHPNTKKSFDINIPHWDYLITKIQEISEYLPQLSYMGFDIIITDNGFKIIEINSLTSVTVLPYYYPLLLDNYNKNFFKRKFSENPKTFKRILKTIDN